MRDAGETARGGLRPIALHPGEPAVWDGRYEITADRPGLTVTALKGHASQLADRSALQAVPAAARPALPVVVGRSGAVSLPAHARPLALERFRAAMGFIETERDV